LRSDPPANPPYLAAYITAGPPYPAPAQLRTFLSQSLPDYMLPTTFTRLPSFPLTPNGKLDRAALPVPDHASTRAVTAYTPPSSPLEERLARIWSDVLGVERVGIHDNFFALGGDSMFAVRLVNRMQDESIGLDVASVFQAPTIGQMADLIAPGTGSEAAPSPAPTEPFALVSADDLARLKSYARRASAHASSESE
jgi:aryl carrier-like protein